MPTLDDAAIARHYLAHSHRKLTDAVGNMQAGYGFPAHWSAGRGVEVGPVGIWRYHYPEQDHNTRFVYCGLCLKPVDENDGGLYSYRCYENVSVDDPKPIDIGDGFYAFVCIDATSDDCRHIPGFTNNRWYERSEGALVASEDGPNADSTGWWHHSTGEGGRAGYAKICALQDLLDGDGRIGNELKNWIHSALFETVCLWKVLFGPGG